MKYALYGMFLGIVFGSAISVATLNDNPELLPSVKELAVQYKCGGYNHENGSFYWEMPMTIEGIVIPEIKARVGSPKGIEITAPRGRK